MDQARLIAEVMARTGVRLSPDDPALAIVELNKLAFEDIIERTGERLDPLAERIDKAARLAAAEVSRSTLRIIGEETRQARAAICAEADSARLAAATAIARMANHYRSSESRLFPGLLGAALALVLVFGGFAAGYALGLSERAHQRVQRGSHLERSSMTLTMAEFPSASVPERSLSHEEIGRFDGRAAIGRRTPRRSLYADSG